MSWFNHETRVEHLLKELIDNQNVQISLLRQVLIRLEPTYRVVVKQEGYMTTGVIVGGTGKFLAQLEDNGQPIALPAGSTWVWATNDTGTTVAADPADTTGGTVDVTIPAGDTNTTVTITASTTDPTGATQSGSLTFPVLPVPQKFTVTVSQIS